MDNVAEQINKIEKNSLEKVVQFNALTNIAAFKRYKIKIVIKNKPDFLNLKTINGLKKETTFSREDLYDDEEYFYRH
ncbi:MAG: hypothetical protein HQK79_22190 [Desulfobacterales bacterium]|nr:hypothetical protein [Desulfobacterales bacterium]